MSKGANSYETQVVVLAGGQGTRFWPISRQRRPKQFLSISSSGESLIQATVKRCGELMDDTQKPLIVTHKLHRELVVEHVPEAEILSEPVGRNTAASIGIAAMHLRKRGGDPVMVVLPADHAIQNEERFNEIMKAAVKLAAEHELLVTIGIEPLFPNTGYGYIKRGVPLNGTGFMVRRFYEKPNLERAVEYCKSGEFYWNSGMFAWRTSVILESIEEHMPQLYNGLEEYERAIGTKSEAEVLEKVFGEIENISIDFGVLELARNCAVVPAPDLAWNDVGSWDAWAEHFSKDKEGNLLHGDALAIDSSNCVVYSANRFMVVLGAEEMVVIDSGDAVLVCPRKRVQDVKKVVDLLRTEGRENLI